jgi:hypothetical protein
VVGLISAMIRPSHQRRSRDLGLKVNAQHAGRCQDIAAIASTHEQCSHFKTMVRRQQGPRREQIICNVPYAGNRRSQRLASALMYGLGLNGSVDEAN